MPEHKEICLLINDKQSVKLKSVSVPFKIYADFDCVLKGVKSNDKNKNTEKYTEKYQDHLSCYFAYNVYVLMIILANELLFTEERNAVMFIEDEEKCKLHDKCLICKNIISPHH